MRYAPVILAGRLVRIAARLRKRDGGSAVPGLIVNRLAPGFLAATLDRFERGLVVVSGSSGKSTTTKLLVAVLEAHGLRVFTNPSTANISQGLSSALLERVRLNGTVDADIAVLEMDEGHGALLAPQLSPRVVALTNVMTDQIDRFHDSEKVAGLLGVIASRATEAIVSNGDDAMLEALVAAARVPVLRYGVSAEVLAALPRGLGYTRTTERRIDGGTVVRRTEGRDTVLETPRGTLSFSVPARGAHYAVDAAAAVSTAAALLGESFDPATAEAALSAVRPVFGRGEVVTVRGKAVEFVLVQNPASFQLNVDHLPPRIEQLLVAMGSDVRDPSYFWPVDASALGTATIVSGSKAAEIALQLAYQGVDIGRVEPDLAVALDDFLALPEPDEGVKTIVFTADSMRRTRTHLGLA